MIVCSVLVPTDPPLIEQLETSGDLTAVPGHEKYEISCTFIGFTAEQIQLLSLRLIKGELNLISVPPLYLNDNITIHSSVHNRVTVARFDANNHGTKITFHSITCDDQGSYTWAAIYYDGGVKTVTARLLITITGII